MGAGQSPRYCACAAKAREVSVCQEFNDRNSGDIFKSSKTGYSGDRYGRRVPRCVQGCGRPRGASDMMRETLEELLRESPALKRIVACPTTPEETRTVVSGPSGEDTVSEGADL